MAAITIELDEKELIFFARLGIESLIDRAMSSAEQNSDKPAEVLEITEWKGK